MPEKASTPAPIAVDIWFRCPQCQQLTYIKEFEQKLRICSKCGYYGRLRWYERVMDLLDEGSFIELDPWLETADPLKFQTRTDTYADKIRDTQYRTGLGDALITGHGTLDGRRLALAVADFTFLGASMGSVFGEKFIRLVEVAIQQKLPLLTISTSGGARMHEGLFSLMQMAKTTAGLAKLGRAGLPHLALLVDPCYGGVTASYPMIADFIMAEPGAMIGFAGPRVIEQTIRASLPEGFQTAEFLLEHGMINQVVERKDLKTLLGNLLEVFEASKIEANSDNSSKAPGEVEEDSLVAGPESASDKSENQSILPAGMELAANGKAAGAAWEKVKLARHPQRPHTLDYINSLCSTFIELHGDRRFGDDAALVGGLALFEGRPVVVMGHQKGRDTKENLKRNFGMPLPEGYRKALRLFRLAEKFKLPVLCFIDTPGAYPGLEGEERGVAQAIAENLLAMAEIAVPLIAVVIGEGGSGGALAIGLADRVLMLENSIYAVASPEAAASILWRDPSLAPEAASALKITAGELYEMGLVDEVIAEPEGGAHLAISAMIARLGPCLKRHLDLLEQELGAGPARLENLVERRYQKFRAIGAWREAFIPCEGN